MPTPAILHPSDRDRRAPSFRSSPWDPLPQGYFGDPWNVFDFLIVIGSIIDDDASVKALRVPEVGEGRTGVYLEAIRKAAGLISDRPVFAGSPGHIHGTANTIAKPGAFSQLNFHH